MFFILFCRNLTCYIIFKFYVKCKTLKKDPGTDISLSPIHTRWALLLNKYKTKVYLPGRYLFDPSSRLSIRYLPIIVICPFVFITIWLLQYSEITRASPIFIKPEIVLVHCLIVISEIHWRYLFMYLLFILDLNVN